jgi:ectoine hydroxylase-related dioxygenase (phytanoyl-CoA dioxygenase family)
MNLFRAESDEAFFRENGYVVLDLLRAPAIEEIFSFYSTAFGTKRQVHSFAQDLPYYISIFDKDGSHRKEVDQLISSHVRAGVEAVMPGYEVFYSNFMIKFPGDGQIESHQDFNFVDESRYTAFNLWCPLVDTTPHNGGLFVIPGSHLVFKTQRGPNITKALTRYNELLQRYAIFVPMVKGQAIVFDHKLIHYSPPNRTGEVRVAVQSVLKPTEAEALHYFFDQARNKVIAYGISKNYILDNNLWNADPVGLLPHHEEELIPFPEEDTVKESLVRLKVTEVRRRCEKGSARPVFRDKELQKSFDSKGFVTLPFLQPEEIAHLRALFTSLIGDDVSNTDYGMYISLEERDHKLKSLLIEKLSSFLAPIAQQHFVDCKPHLGSFLVKAPGPNSFTYPHQDWTFVEGPDSRSLTVWIALVDTDEHNGALGFVSGSQYFFDKPVGSPSPDYKTFTQGHEATLYEYLEFVPLRAGQAIAFDNRTIHGAPPNLSGQNRVAVAIGMTPQESPLYHYYLLPSSKAGNSRRIAKIKVDRQFFQRYSVASLKELFDRGGAPEGYAIEEIIEDVYQPFTSSEIGRMCEGTGLKRNGKRLTRSTDSSSLATQRSLPARCAARARAFAGRVRGRFPGAGA